MSAGIFEEESRAMGYLVIEDEAWATAVSKRTFISLGPFLRYQLKVPRRDRKPKAPNASLSSAFLVFWKRT